MLIKRITTWLAAVAACLALASTATAQRTIHHGPPAINPSGTNPDLAQPFVDLDTFHSDFQFFAPAELGEFGQSAPANTGWFGQYDRLYIWVTRPETRFTGDNAPGRWTMGNQGITEGDFTWGNRLDLGYMTEEGHGWLFSGHHVDGPNEDAGFNTNMNSLIEERLNRVNTMTGEILPVQDRNNRLTGGRDYLMLQSINVADLSGFEFNKTFRLKPFHHGSTIEPFLGFRYFKFVDYHRRTRYERFDAMGLPVPILPPPAPSTATFEQFTEDFSSFTNHMVGGQLGVRWFQIKSRWTLSSQFRMFAVQNFQAFNTQTDTVTTESTVATGAAVVLEQQERFTSNENSAEFVLGGEVRVEAAYELTRDFSLNVGAEVMHFGMGIARGDVAAFNDEDLTLVGATFGFTYNR